MRRLKEFRKRARMTQQELADRIGVTKQYISQLEKDKRVASLIVAVHLAVTLHICLGMLTDARNCYNEGKNF